MNADWKLVQQWAGVAADGQPGPVTARALVNKLGLRPAFNRSAFLARHINTNAPAITRAQMVVAAARLGVSEKHLDMLREVESGGRSFDNSGRPVILFEPHIFHRRTSGRHGITSFSYPNWRDKPYPGSYDGRWAQIADAAGADEQAALESASWGLWQIMGFHWEALGYPSARAFAHSMVESEAGHLEALVRFIEKNNLTGKLQACRPRDPDSCRPFARAYNGAGYAKNRYHEKMAEALR